MTPRVDWYIDTRVLYANWSDGMDMEAIQRIDRAIQNAFEYGKDPIHVIADLRMIGTMPTTPVMKQMFAPFIAHERLGWAVMVCSPSRTAAFASVLPRVCTQNRCRIVTSLEDAVQLLAEDWTLDFLKTNPRIFLG